MVLSMMLEALAPIATFNDDHDIWFQLGHVISARRGLLAPRYRNLLPMCPTERATEVKGPDVVQHMDLVLVEHRGVRAPRRQNIWS